MNKNLKELCLLASGLALLFVLSLGGSARAEETTTTAPSDSLTAKLEKLENLRAENPEAFRKWVDEHKQGLRQRMADLKQNNPQKFEEIVSRRRALRDGWLERTKQKNPRQYERWMTHCRENFNQRLEEFKSRNPERYAQWMKNRAQRNAQMRERRQQFLTSHPQAAERIKQRHPARIAQRKSRENR